MLLFSEIQAIPRHRRRELFALQPQAQRCAVQQVRGKGEEGIYLTRAEKVGLDGGRRRLRLARENGGEVAHGTEKGFLQVEHLRLGEQAVQVGRVRLPDSAGFIAGEHVPVNAGSARQLADGAVEKDRPEETDEKGGRKRTRRAVVTRSLRFGGLYSPGKCRVSVWRRRRELC